MKRLELSSELFLIYLKDQSEQANIGAINAVTEAFGCDTGALFYKNAKDMYKVCLAGSAYPISIPGDKWEDLIGTHTSSTDIHLFRHWAPPGLDIPVEHWMSLKLQPSEVSSVYVFLGRNSLPWNGDEQKAFTSVSLIISEISSIRYRRDLEEKSRHEAEDALKLTQTRMSAFFDGTHDMIYTTDSEDRFTSVNGAGLALFGFSDKDQMIGMPFSKFTLNAEAHVFYMKEIREKGFVKDHEIVVKNTDGSLIYCIETAHAVRRADGSIMEVQGLLKDITERIKIERELWATNFKLSEANLKLKQAQDFMVQQEKLASIGQLAAGIAHEINNPLGFLKSNQNMLRSYFSTISELLAAIRVMDDPAIREACDRAELDYILEQIGQILDESDDGFVRIKQIVSHLMGFSRSGAMGAPELYDVNEGVESTLAVARNELKYVAEVTKKYGSLPKIFANKGEINQVILNILVNAAQAIASQKREAKGHIDVETRVEGSRVAILITDDGPGIPETIRSRIFDPFFTTKDPGKGTGLGLSISYDIIVTKHHGELTVDSAPGKGTCFRILLPHGEPAAELINT